VAILAVRLCYFTSREVFDVWKCVIFVTVLFVYFMLLEFENNRSERPSVRNVK